MEGLAQTVLALVAEDGEEDDFINMYDTVGHYHAALTNNAQLDIEDGKSIDQTIRDVLGCITTDDASCTCFGSSRPFA